MAICVEVDCGCQGVNKGLKRDKEQSLDKQNSWPADTPKCAANDYEVCTLTACPEHDFTYAVPGLPSEETRATDAVSGGQKGVKQAQLGAVDPLALMELAKVAGFGADKYARYNFLKGYSYSWSYDALQRHLNAFWSGEDTDPESKLLHLSHAMWHCAALISFTKRKLGTDDRPPRP